MGQQCPRCRLFSPDEAVRCDCGYDFITKAMKGSYLVAHSVEKQGGPERARETAVRGRIRTAVTVLLLSAGISGLASLVAPEEAGKTGRGYFIVLGGSTCVAILLIRWLNQRRIRRKPVVLSADQSEADIEGPHENGYHEWLRQMNADPAGFGVRGWALVFAAVAATLVFAILGLVLFPEGRYPHIILALPGILAGSLVSYGLGFLVYKLPKTFGIAACGFVGSVCIWLVLLLARTYKLWP